MLFTFPSRYLFTIGRQLVFSLAQWSARIHTRLHLYRVTQEFPRCASVFGYGPLTLYGAIFHSLHLTSALPHRAPTTPLNKLSGLVSSAFARHYLRNRIRFLFLWLLRCFTSPGIALVELCIHTLATGHSPSRVTPFGRPRVKAYLPLSVAYRSLSRPSSPVGTKASIMCS